MYGNDLSCAGLYQTRRAGSTTRIQCSKSAAYGSSSSYSIFQFRLAEPATSPIFTDSTMGYITEPIGYDSCSDSCHTVYSIPLAESYRTSKITGSIVDSESAWYDSYPRCAIYTVALGEPKHWRFLDRHWMDTKSSSDNSSHRRRYKWHTPSTSDQVSGTLKVQKTMLGENNV